MPTPRPDTRLRKFVDLFVENQVKFIVVGEHAEILHGSPRMIHDVDLCYERSEGNISALVNALKTLNPTLRGAPAGLPFILNEKTIRFGNNFTLRTNVADLDLLGHVEPHGDYKTLIGNAESYTVGKHDVDAIALEDLITVKQHIQRERQRIAV